MRNYELELQSLFINTVSGLKTSMKGTMKEKGLLLSPLYFMILKQIHDIENCTAHHLAESTERDKGQITRLVNEVMDHGYVIKTPNPNDKRSQFLQFTNKGLECYQQLASADHAILAKMRADISDDDLQKFLGIGQKMLANLNAINNKP
jgi:DNA-binding MarR family transcriptional regulator